MAKKFNIKTFLRQINDSLLIEYFSKLGINYQPNDVKAKERMTQVENLIDLQPEELKNKINVNFEEIAELANEKGNNMLREILEDFNLTLIRGFGEAGNEYEQSFFCFLHAEIYFYKALQAVIIENIANKQVRTVRNTLSVEKLGERTEELSKYLCAYFSDKEGRGRNCKVDFIELSGRVCFIAYPEDYAKSFLFYKEDRLEKLQERPSFQIIFIYYPEDKLVELSARGRAKKLNALFNIFNEAVLGDTEPLSENEMNYSLNKILEDDFTIPVDPEDQVQKIFLKQIRLTKKNFKLTRITVEIEDGEGLESMKKELQYLRVNPEYYNVSEATFRIKFPGEGNRGSVTMRLTYPNRHNLTETESNEKAKKYLFKWGLANEQRTSKLS